MTRQYISAASLIMDTDDQAAMTRTSKGQRNPSDDVGSSTSTNISANRGVKG